MSTIFFLPKSPLANLKEYTIGPQDVLQIEVWDHPDLTREATVSLKNTISFPLIGEIIVKGLTSEQLQKIIRNNLADGYLVNPQVTVTVKAYNSQKIYVLGEVDKPGYYPFSKVTSMVELISMAGGLTRDAGQEAFIIRPQEKLPQEDRRVFEKKWAGNLNAVIEATSLPEENLLNSQVITISLNDFNQGINLNFELQNMDTLYIPKAKFFYVIGEVKSPGRFKLEKEMNVLQAISMAGGLTKKANEKKPKIIRTIEGKEQKITGSMADLVFPDDIIKVPESFF